jgi:hypothetical protein
MGTVLVQAFPPSELVTCSIRYLPDWVFIQKMPKQSRLEVNQEPTIGEKLRDHSQRAQ